MNRTNQVVNQQPVVNQTNQVGQVNQAVQNSQVIAGQVNQVPVNAKTKTKRNRKKTNPLIYLIILVVIVIGAFLFFNLKSESVGLISERNQIVTKDKIDTGSDWGDSYAYYIQTLFDDVATIEVAFVDFDEDETPEMAVRYTDDYEEVAYKVYYLINNNVYETKYFYDASFKILYSLKNHTSKWYIYLASSKNFGAYTAVDKLMNGIAYDSDIKVNNNEERKTFNGNYIESDFNVTYYHVKKDSFVNDFKTVVSRYDKYVLDIQNAKNNLAEKYKDSLTDDDKPKETHITVGEYELPYGTYVYQGVNGVDKVHTLKIYDSGFISVDDISYKFTINLNGYFELSNGNKVAVLDNSRLVYEERTYTFSTAN